MARYIDADKLIEALRVDYDREGARADDMDIKRIADASVKYSHGQFCFLNAIERVKDIPTADVVPKSEVEKIFSEIDNWFELYSEREFSFAEEEASKEHLPESEAHDYALDIIKELRQLCVAELKKKYTGVEDGDGRN